MRFLYSFILSSLINILILFFLAGIGRQDGVKIYKAYKINLVRLPPKEHISSKPLVPKPILSRSPQERPKQEVSLPLEKASITEEGAIPVTKEEPEEVSHLITTVPQERPPQEGPRIYEPEGLDAPLRLIRYTLPEYPAIAKKKGIEGRVRVRLLVNPEGEVDKAEIFEEEPKGLGFGEEVLKVVRTYRFSPPTVLGKGVYVYCLLPLRFSLED